MTKQFLIISLILLGLVQFSFGQSKQQQVSQLVKSTGQIFPYRQFEGKFQMTKGMITDEFETGVSEMLMQKIESMRNLSPAQKRKLKTKSPEFVEQYTNFVDFTIGKNFRMKNWVNESATKHFTRQFTIAELQKINAFFQTVSGQKALVAMRIAFAKGFNFDINEGNFADAEKYGAEAEKFMDSELGTKFFNVLMENIIMDVAGKIDGWKKQVAQDFDAHLNEKEFNILVGAFVKRTLEA